MLSPYFRLLWIHQSAKFFLVLKDEEPDCKGLSLEHELIKPGKELSEGPSNELGPILTHMTQKANAACRRGRL